MGDSDGWQTVLPTNLDRLPRPQLEAYERQVLHEWARARGNWSGIGKHIGDSARDAAESNKVHSTRFKVDADFLGTGAYGVVERVTYTHQNRSVFLARKHIRQHRRWTVEMLREEAHLMEELCHEHIVQLVGTYCVRQRDLFILLWPVAVCNLDVFLTELNDLGLGQGDGEHIRSRLERLHLQDMAAAKDYLQRAVGCMAHAVAYCHQKDIRHLDLKPSNILLNPGRVYLADFGIAKDVKNRDHTMTAGLQGTLKWRAPEIREYRDSGDEWSMQSADVYALGLIFLNITTLLYGGTMADFDAMVELPPHLRADRLHQYMPRLAAMALATQHFVSGTLFGPRPIVPLMQRMVQTSPDARPDANRVNTELSELGGFEQVYHNACCRKTSRFVMERMDRRLAAAEESRQTAERELQVLKDKDATYELRIQRERSNQTAHVARLQDHLQKEKAERTRLEKLLAGAQHGGRRRQGPWSGQPGSGNHSHPRGQGMHARDATGISLGVPTPASTPTTTPPRPPQSSARNAAHHRQPPPPHSPSLLHPQQRSANASLHTPMSYSQTVSAGLRPPPSPTRRRHPDTQVPATPPRSSPVPAAATAGHGPGGNGSSPAPHPVGNYPLRSRNSGSRLPLAVASNSSTSLLSLSTSSSSFGRARTPNLRGDSSLTDSTQTSMASSSRYSPALGASVMGAFAGAKSHGGHENRASAPAFRAGHGGVLANGREREEDGSAASDAEHEHLDDTAVAGLGLTMADMAAARDVSVGNVSSARGMREGPRSTISGSALSSPRLAKADVASVASAPSPTGGPRMPPSLPTAKSWADVARSS